MATPFLPLPLYRFLFGLLGLVYLAGLFVPLMDNDSAHHANIALHMHLTGDYISLVDYAGDYLDKPHLHFWLCALSYKIFGVTSFAYKFPSLLFTIAGLYATFQLGKRLYDSETGRLAALILASSFAVILANNDVRMDAILMACIALSCWQLVVFIQDRTYSSVTGAALALALGFSTKGHIAVFVPAIAVVSYLLYKNEWRLLLNWKWILLAVLFALFIAPVVYAYYLQFNQHPEIIVRGKDHIDGVKFILLNQSIERFSGTMGSDAKHDYLFFLHSFLWAFAPWSVLAYWSLATRLRTLPNRKYEWLTIGVFCVMLIVVSLSGFKLPHYLNIVFPTTAVLLAAFLRERQLLNVSTTNIYRIQLAIVLLLLIGLFALNTWAFPVHRIAIIAGWVVLLAIVFYLMRSSLLSKLQRAVAFSVATMALCFFLLNTSFYPQLLTYQGGNQLAFATKGKIDPAQVYYWGDMQSSSFSFYTRHLRQVFSDTVLKPGTTQWLLFDIQQEKEIKAAGYQLGKRFTSRDYEITKLDIRFVNPAKRDSQCTEMVLAEVRR